MLIGHGDPRSVLALDLEQLRVPLHEGCASSRRHSGTIRGQRQHLDRETSLREFRHGNVAILER